MPSMQLGSRRQDRKGMRKSSRSHPFRLRQHSPTASNRRAAHWEEERGAILILLIQLGVQLFQRYFIYLCPHVLVPRPRSSKLLTTVFVFQDCDDEEAEMILEQILNKGLGNLEALESCVGPRDLRHAHFENRHGKRIHSTCKRHCKDKSIAPVNSRYATKVWQLMLTHIAFKKSDGA